MERSRVKITGINYNSSQMKIGIIKERKSPPDRRVVLSPSIVKELLEQYPELRIEVEESDVRFFQDNQYVEAGATLVKDVSNCDVLLGVKEVPVDALIADKTYFFFSHTIKKQSYNKGLLKACLDKNIRLIDHETLVDDTGHRLIGFGRYAGIVGAYNTFRAFGIKYELFDLPKAETLAHQEDLIAHLKRPFLPPIKIALTGFGKVGFGAKEMLDGMKIKEVGVADFLTKSYDEPVYVHLDTKDYYKPIDASKTFDKSDFYAHPEKYTSDFERFSTVTDVFVAGHFFKTGNPAILTQAMLNGAHNEIKVIGDVSCDVDEGPIAATLRVSTIQDPFYGYYPSKNTEVPYDHPAAVVVMAVDNLPCELPQDASEGFGRIFADKIIPALLEGDTAGILERATITNQGKLTPNFSYLESFVNS